MSSLLTVLNSPDDGSGGYGSTYIRQAIPSLCKYVSYTFSFDAQLEGYSGYTNKGCRIEINLNGTPLYNAPNYQSFPYGYQRLSYSFQYGGCPPYGEFSDKANTIVEVSRRAGFGKWESREWDRLQARGPSVHNQATNMMLAYFPFFPQFLKPPHSSK
ncbi:MAG: hypothetical protein Q9198_002221 [Flavoplaca austrocitrina]